jgi:hypothetical protein
MNLDQKRLEANKRCVELIKVVVEQKPHLRFTQILTTLDLDDLDEDRFYEEPWTTVELIMDKIGSINVDPETII